MSKPFDFIEKTVAVAGSGITWLPYALGGVAAAGLASVPIMGLIEPKQPAAGKREKPKQEWANSETMQGEPLPIATPPPIENDAPILIPNPEDPTQELQSVDETLADLGLDFGPGNDDANKKPSMRWLRGREVAASKLIEPEPANLKESEGEDGKGGFRIRRVKKGETLFGIAAETGSTPAELAAMNQIDPERPIHVGQELKVPGSDEGAQLALNRSFPDDTETEPLASERPVVATGAIETSIRRPRTVTPEQREVSGHVPSTARVSSPQPLQPVNHYPASPYDDGVANDPPVAIAPIEHTSNPFETADPYDSEIPPYTETPHDTIAAPSPYVPVPGETTAVAPVAAVPGPSLFPPSGTPTALPNRGNPLDRYNHAIAYRVQLFDNMNRIADARATTAEELILLNGRAKISKGEMIIVPVDNSLIKNGN